MDLTAERLDLLDISMPKDKNIQVSSFDQKKKKAILASSSVKLYLFSVVQHAHMLIFIRYNVHHLS